MKYCSLRDLVERWPKHQGCIKIARAPLINEGFKGTFNLSFSEMPWLTEYGRFIDFDHDSAFTTIQTCIRPNDLALLRSVDSSTHLGVFEMASLTGIVNFKKQPDYSVLQREQFRRLVNFLENIGIEKERIYLSYCIGGALKDITSGKYDFGFTVPADEISRNAFVENGIPERNILQDKTRDTFLAMYCYRPAPWGYRNEIFVNLATIADPLLLDLATLEYSLWKPKFRNGDITSSKNIIGLDKAQDGCSILVVGLERLCMVINGFVSVKDVDYIQPVYTAFKSISKSQDELAVESLRALHRIYSDIREYKCKLSKHHKQKISKMLQSLPLEKLDEKSLRELLQMHTDAQPWHPELKDGIEPTVERIEKYRLAKNQ